MSNVYEASIADSLRDLVCLCREFKNQMAVPLNADSATTRQPTVPQWIPCEERLPEVGQTVLLCLSDGSVHVGCQNEPEFVWQVTDVDGERLWVYDPEEYTKDVDSLPKTRDCTFSDETDCYSSITSINRGNGSLDSVVAWQPLPDPYPYQEGGTNGNSDR